MSLTLALNNALTGLNVNQRSLATLSHNIANANTEGYSRQIVDQSALYLDGTGAGVRIDDISRKVDVYLLKAIRTQSAEVGEVATVNDFMERIQVMLGEPGSDNSIDEYVENFFNALQALSETPERTSFRTTAVGTGEVLAREISNTALNLETLRYQADQDMNDAVKFINSTLQHLSTINDAIARARALGGPTAGLFDQRDMALKQISEFMDIDVLYKESGVVHVFVGNGISLLDDYDYELEYREAQSIDNFIEDADLNAMQVYRLDDAGNRMDSKDIITAGTGDEITTVFTTGKLKGLANLRDQIIPNMLEQFDQLAATLRDQLNAIHNDGSGYPGASELLGTRQVYGQDVSDWSGTVQIAVLNEDGTPADSPWSDEISGFRPLNLDLSALDDGQGPGTLLTVQSIINEINNHFGIQQNRVDVGNLNNIEMAFVSDSLPNGAPSLMEFDFDLENISGENSQFFVTDVQVFDDTGANITNVTNTAPSVALDPVNTFTTTLGSNVVTVTSTTIPNLLNEGDYVYLEDPGAAVNGIPGADFNNFFKVTNVTSSTFEIELATPATAAGVVAVVGQTATPKYDEIEPGDQRRTGINGTYTANLALNPGSSFYTYSVHVGVIEPDPENPGEDIISTSVVTYKVTNSQANLRNDRVAPVTANNDGTIHLPQTTQPYIRAIMVDENGNELPKINGDYGSQPGFLKLIAGDGLTISINELDSLQLGSPSSVPPVDGTNRHFSHYFELNNFFQSNEPTITGDTVRNSAINMAVEDRILSNSNLISTGHLVRSNQPTDPDDDPLWTYERFSGDNTLAQRLSGLGLTSLAFDAAGGLPDTEQTFNGYAGEILGYAGTTANSASASFEDSKILLDGFQERSDAISGVNLDEELANTIIFQNAYAASARVISVTNDLFDILVNLGN